MNFIDNLAEKTEKLIFDEYRYTMLSGKWKCIKYVKKNYSKNSDWVFNS